ncbi:MAG TPA: iron-sulfur cluster insertion protein ErpA [Rhizomicrobium sp.]|nr:iron-sulfur cluster insertion protein ErpA [Rhizomicrobium sp.]
MFDTSAKALIPQREGQIMTIDTQEPVTLSARAAKRIAEILKAETDPVMLRVAVTGGGCSGFQYNYTLDDVRLDDDLVIAKDGATVLVDPVSLEFLKGSEIDFTDDLIGAAFKIVNPNAQSSCGCGTSFSV